MILLSREPACESGSAPAGWRRGLWGLLGSQGYPEGYYSYYKGSVRAAVV